jgi:hypothetical protein
MTSAEPFQYPQQAHVRKHGPLGFTDYADYKDWLRDEFDFRCVYCLRREAWQPRRAVWVVEHLIPRTLRPDLTTVYSNLVLACATCNSWKSADHMPDPCQVGYGLIVRVAKDGAIHALSPEGQKLISVARLDDEESTEWRWKHIHLIKNYRIHEPDEYQRWMGFPHLLPDLANRRVKGNTKPEGAKKCRYGQKMAGTLPTTYH